METDEISLVDNDIVLKICCYDLVEDLIALLTPIGVPSILGSARYVIGSRIAKSNKIRDRSAVGKRFMSALASLQPLEPSDSELQLASEFEEQAQLQNQALDSGESILLAILLSRWAPLFLTGDKRAIASCEAMLGVFEGCLGPPGFIVCLEQILGSLMRSCDAAMLQARICNEGDIDKAVAIIFSCASGSLSPDSIISGLTSYTASLRCQAPSVLLEDGCL